MVNSGCKERELRRLRIEASNSDFAASGDPTVSDPRYPRLYSESILLDNRG